MPQVAAEPINPPADEHMGVTVRFRKGAWWVFINHHGRRKAKRVGDKATALSVARTLRERLARVELQLEPAPAIQTLKSYIEGWQTVVKGTLKASTVSFYDGVLNNHILPALGSRDISSLSRQDCRELIATCRAKGLRTGTLKGIVRALSTILTQAVEDEILPANPALRMGRYLRQGDEAVYEPDPFTRDEVVHILAVAFEHFPEWHPWLMCGLRTGMRAGELLALQWGDIDWRGSFIHLERNLVRGVLTTPKNHQRRRIDMSRQLRATLRLWRRHQSIVWLKKGQASAVMGVRLDRGHGLRRIERAQGVQSNPRQGRAASARSASDAPHLRLAAHQRR